MFFYRDLRKKYLNIPTVFKFILSTKDVATIHSDCNFSMLWLWVTYPVSNSTSQVTVISVLRVCCSSVWCVICVYISFLCKNCQIFIMSAEEEVLRIQKKLNKMSSGDGTVSKWVKYSCVPCSAYWSSLSKALQCKLRLLYILL